MVNGPGDDIERRLSDIEDRLDEIVDILSMVTRPEGEQEEAIPSEDMWREGELTRPASNELEYREERVLAANDDDIRKPRYTGDEVDRVSFYFKVFKLGYENIEAINDSLSNGEFKDFIQKLAIDHGNPEELVEVADPEPEFFGFFPDTVNVGFQPAQTNIDLVKMWDWHWYWPNQREVEVILGDGDRKLPNHPEALQIPEPRVGETLNGASDQRLVNIIQESHLVEGKRPDIEMTNALVDRIVELGLEVPEDFRGFRGGRTA